MDRFRLKKEDMQKRGWRDWLQNYWFYYKWPTVIILCILILGSSILYSMLNQMQYDATVPCFVILIVFSHIKIIIISSTMLSPAPHSRG